MITSYYLLCKPGILWNWTCTNVSYPLTLCVCAGVDGQWRVDVVMSIRPSSSTGVLFALVSNDTVPLTLSVLTQETKHAVRLLHLSLPQHYSIIILIDVFILLITILPFPNSLSQYLQVFLENTPVAKLESLMLCYPERLEVEFHVSAHDLQISGNSSNMSYTETEALRQALVKLNATMQRPVFTYIGGLPGIACFVCSFY